MNNPELPIIFQQGAPKSASSFCSQMLRAIAEQNGADQEIARKKLGVKYKRVYISDMQRNGARFAALPPLSVIKTHQAPGSAEKLLKENKAVAFITFRDPLDSVRSLLDHAESSRVRGKTEFADIESPLEAARVIVLHYSFSMIWLRNPNVHPVFFNDLKHRPIKTAQSMATIIGVDINKVKLRKKLSNPKKITRFNVGEVGRGQDLLDGPDGDELRRMFAPFYRGRKWVNGRK